MDIFDDPDLEKDICRVCRLEGIPGQSLFHPCLCTGSIKYIHQICLVQWMRYSGKEYCVLCGHRLSFALIYAPDTPQWLPIKYVAACVTSSVFTGIKYWLRRIYEGFTSLIVIPFIVCQIYRSLFNDSFGEMMSLPIEVLLGHLIIACVSLVFYEIQNELEQIFHGGGPNWLEQDENINQQQQIPEENPAEENNRGVREENGNPPLRIFEWEHLIFLELGPIRFITCGFYVVFMVTLCILVLGFLPYQIGNLAISTMFLQDKVLVSHLVIIFCGYCLISMLLLAMHTFANVVGFRRSKRIIGLSYIVVKVFVLSVAYIVALPLVCGWWLDICSLSMFDVSFEDRLASFRLAPDLSVLSHWLAGTIYVVYYWALFVLLLQEVIRPGVLWFLWDFNRDYNIRQELIRQGMLQHGRNLIVLVMLFGTAVFLVVWLPIRILKLIWPSFLPYNVTSHSESDYELCFMEQLYLQYLLIGLLQTAFTQNWLKMALHNWCVIASHLLGIKSYLLGDGEEPPPGVTPIHPPAANLAAHEVLLRRSLQHVFCPYTTPSLFALRLIALLVLAALSLIVISLSVLTIPVWLGRLALSFWLSSSPTTSTSSKFQSTNVHELYTIACGTCICWLLILVWFMKGPAGHTYVINQLKFCLITGFTFIVALTVLGGIMPFLLGLLLKLVFVVPFEVNLHQTPLLRNFEVLTLGIVGMNIACMIIGAGPDWSLKRTLGRVFVNGFINLDLKLILQDLAKPVIKVLSLSLAVPYVVAYSIVPLCVNDESLKLLISRIIYPTFMVLMIVIKCIVILLRKFKRLYVRIKNDRYLVGRRIVNLNHTNLVSGQN